MIKVRFQDTSFRDGFQSVYGARVLTKDFMPAVEASVAAGINHFEAGGGARFQSLFFYCGESAFDMMDEFRRVAGPTANLQTLARGINTVALSQSPRDMIELHAQMFKKHGMTTIRNFDALNDINNLSYSGECITKAGLHHQIVITMMDLPPGCEGAHTTDFYLGRLRQILDSGTPFDSICFKDATGTANPQKVYETFKGARDMVGDDMLLWFHTHDTCGVAVAQNLAAIEGGATKDDNVGICLAKSPVSGGTSQVDIISMWHALKGKGFSLDVDVMKILEAEEVFEECMKDYFVPAEAKQVSPVIPLSPMPGGALTANTMMMRDTGTLHLYNDVIKEMSEVVKLGGFASSVTPVSQFYFQQAFANVTQGRWNKITDGYGQMVLGYFGKTPTEPDAKVVEIAAEQLGKKPFSGNPLDELEPARPGVEKLLKENNIEVSDENVFTAFACGSKGIDFLKGKFTVNVRKNEAKKEAVKVASPSKVAEADNGRYVVNVDGKDYRVQVSADTGAVLSAIPVAAGEAPAAAPVGEGEAVCAAMPGAVVSFEVEVGDTVAEGDVLLIVEAMKMESPIKAQKAGKILSIDVEPGDNVQSGDTLLYIG